MMLELQRVWLWLLVLSLSLVPACKYDSTANFRADQSRYILLEQGLLEERCVFLLDHTYFLGAGAQGYLYAVLSEKLPSNLDEADRHFRHAAPWQKISDSSDKPNAWPPLERMIDRYPPHVEQPIIWILGTNPLIVAKGVKKSMPNATLLDYFVNGRTQLPGTFRLITRQDLDERISSVRISSCWPHLLRLSASEWNNQAQLVTVEHAVFVPISGTPTLREVMAKLPKETEEARTGTTTVQEKESG